METAGLVQGVPSPPRPQLSPPTATAMTTPPLLPFKLDKTPMYSSPPPAASNPENNTCKLIEYRGAKVAAFSVDSRELICLPQAFELFLKHLVGGLHTVYTKLKRLEITPVVCNVEQVRVLRGLGAIQPGVNRCKLISPKEFDVLYDDCTNSSARPGRPPKRSTSITATPDTLEKLKKSRLENGDFAFAHMHDPKKAALLGNGYHYPPHLAPLPFMPMAHPAMMSMAMASHLGMRQEQMAFHAQEKDYHPHRAAEPKDEQTLEKPQDKPLDLNIKSDDNHNHKRAASIESGTSTSSDILGHPIKTGSHLLDDVDDVDSLDDDDDDDLDDSDMSHETPGLSPAKPSSQNLTYAAQLLNASESTQVSSIETLLMNIQGLLKVAVENARHQERQIKYETAELKVEVQKEKDMRSAIEKQLSVETRHRATLQKRLKKERKARRKLQDQLEMILKQRTLAAEDHNNQPIPALHRLSEPINDEPPVLENRVMDQDRNTQAPTPPSMKGYMESILGQTCTSAANGFIHSPTTPSVSAPSVVKAE